MLSQNDLQKIAKIVDTIVDAKLFDIREEVKKIQYLPTSNELHTENDKLMTELKAIREEQPAMSSRIDRNEERIDRVETHLHISHA